MISIHRHKIIIWKNEYEREYSQQLNFKCVSCGLESFGTIRWAHNFNEKEPMCLSCARHFAPIIATKYNISWSDAKRIGIYECN